MSTVQDFTTPYKPTWCSGCGNFGIWASLRRALVGLSCEPHEVLNVYDIGCCGNGSNWFRSYGYHSLHGRALPLAIGARLSNHKLRVLTFAGDGGALGEGGNHFMHSCRTNIDITYFLHDNQLYSLTTGQASPTSQKGMETKSTPSGVSLQELHPLQIAISAGATFVARGYADDLKGLTELMKAAILHKGFAVLDILQPCPTFNFTNTREWYNTYMKKLTAENWDFTNKDKALILAGNWKDFIPVGILYQEERQTLEESLPALSGEPLVNQVKEYDVKELVDELR